MCDLPVSYCVQKPEGSNFTLERACELIKLVNIAHKEFDKSEEKQSWDWNNDTQTPLEPYELLTRFGFAGYFFGKRERVPFGFILRKDSDIFVIFRGTLKPQEWIADAKAVQVNFLDESPSLGQVHKGFHFIYTRQDNGGLINFNTKDDLPSIQEVIKNTFQEKVPEGNDINIFVAGHSLGGALATLAALDIKLMNRSPILYSYASPRVGDSKFAKQFQDPNFKANCYRIANSEDRVTNLPWSIPFLSLITPGSIGELLEEAQSWEHVGYPLYFTAQTGSIPDNHTIPVYMKALGCEVSNN